MYQYILFDLDGTRAKKEDSLAGADVIVETVAELGEALE